MLANTESVQVSELTLPDDQILVVTSNNLRSDFNTYHGYGLYLVG